MFFPRRIHYFERLNIHHAPWQVINLNTYLQILPLDNMGRLKDTFMTTSLNPLAKRWFMQFTSNKSAKKILHTELFASR